MSCTEQIPKLKRTQSRARRKGGRGYNPAIS